MMLRTIVEVTLPFVEGAFTAYVLITVARWRARRRRQCMFCGHVKNY
jgi:hypothetical protein